MTEKELVPYYIYRSTSTKSFYMRDGRSSAQPLLLKATPIWTILLWPVLHKFSSKSQMTILTMRLMRMRMQMRRMMTWMSTLSERLLASLATEVEAEDALAMPLATPAKDQPQLQTRGNQGTDRGNNIQGGGPIVANIRGHPLILPRDSTDHRVVPSATHQQIPVTADLLQWLVPTLPPPAPKGVSTCPNHHTI